MTRIHSEPSGSSTSSAVVGTQQSEPAGPSTASLIGGAALVGAAAGYALLAMRFRNFATTANNAGRFAAGSAEMRAADAFTRDWVRGVESGGAAYEGASFAGRRTTHENGQSRNRTKDDDQMSPGPPAWALQELGLRAGGTSLEEAKAAYRERAKALHPDSPSGDEAAFKKVQAAWEEVQKSTAAS